MSVALHELRAQLLIFRRSRESAFFIFVFPLLLLLLLGAFYDGEIEGEPAANYLLVGILGYGAANTAFGGLAIQLVVRREYGILKRIRSTPLPSWLYLACLLGSNLVVFALQSVGVVVLAVLVYDADWPGRPLSLAAALLAGALCFTGLGLGAAALIRSAEAVAPAVNVAVLPMAFLSGSFGPTEGYPDVLEVLAEILPLRHLIDVVGAIVLDGAAVWSRPGDLAIVAAWGAAGYAVARARFGWEPRER
ncbi:MAG: ABC transporter permease [Actinomycetota bacterium]|nr:ABC transporter permease [Actinomycetota bacterium]